MNETTELIMKQLNSKKVHAETHQVDGGDEIDVLKLKNAGSLVTKTGDFSGTWYGLAMTSVEPGLSTAFNALKADTTTQLTLKADKTYTDAQLALKTNQSSLDTTNSLKADKVYVDTQIAAVASGSPKGTYATLTALQTAYPTGNTNIYVVTADGNWYYWNGSSWIAGGVYQSTGIANDGINYDKIAPQSISFMKHAKHTPVVFKTKPRNLFDKNAVTTGFYIANATGVATANASYTASDYMPVTGGADYALTKVDQGAWYDVNKVYISGITGASPNVVTAPTNAKYFRISTTIANKDVQMFEQASVLGTYEAYFTDLKLNANDYLNDASLSENILDSSLKTKLNSVIRIDQIIKDTLFDLSKPTKIKLIGDSITAGEGSTGYSHNGAFVPGTTIGMNSGGTCWANFLSDLIATRFNKSVLLYATSPQIKYYVPYAYNGAYDSSTILDNFFTGGGTRKAVGFDFYGDTISLGYASFTNTGIVDIYLDGVKQTTLDSYNAASVNSTYQLTGLSMAKHTLEIYETATKNASATAYKFYLQSITVNKKANVVNYGVSGYRSNTILDIANSVLESDDDIVIMQLGTNDRAINDIPSFKRYMRKIVRIGLGKNPNMKFIFMCASPTSAETENTKLYSMYEIDKAIKELAYELNTEYISNYSAFLRHIEVTGATIDSLLADGLHPNDLGHKIMYRNIVRNLGLPYVAEGVIK